MFLQCAVVRTGLMSLTLLLGACSVSPYHPMQPVERPVPVPIAEAAPPPPAAPPPAPPEPDSLASSSNIPPGAPATAAPSDHFVLERVAFTARTMLGVPYHYGGNDPRGFDCSGLVLYAYGEAGVLVPRTSREQMRASHKITVEEALPGDLVFFRTSKRAWHVGIYLGDQRFIHAPSTGRAVVIQRVDDEYYLRHLIQIRRLDDLG
jgi:murein DD-endopeptidase